MTSLTSLPSQRLKIVFFIHSMTYGGAERVALILAATMNSLNVEVTIILAKSHGELISKIPTGVKIIHLNCKKPIQGIFFLAREIKKIRPDAIICFGIYTGIAAALSKAITRWSAPIIIRNESNIEYEWSLERFHNRVIGPALSRWAARSSKIVAVSHALKKPSEEFLRLKKKEAIVIVNPVPLEPETSPQCHPWLPQKPCPTFIAMGRLEHQKGFDILLDAFTLARKQTKCRLIIFGEGSLREELELKIRTLNLTDDVDMPGTTSTPLSQMKESTAFILSSRYEGFGLVLVEALYSGTQIISTDCNYGPAEILENGRFGTLVPNEDAKAMAKAMIEVAQNSVPKKKPEAEWFDQFSPIRAAKKHLELIDQK